MSAESYSSSESEILPAVMLAMLLAVTGLEVLLLAAPHKVVAHPARTVAVMTAASAHR